MKKKATLYEELAESHRDVGGRYKSRLYPPDRRTTSDANDSSSHGPISRMLQKSVGSMNTASQHELSRWCSKHILQAPRGGNHWAFCGYHSQIVLLEGNGKNQGWYDFNNVLHDPQMGCAIVQIDASDLCVIDDKVGAMLGTIRNLGEVLREQVGDSPGELSELSEQRLHEQTTAPLP